MHFIDKVFRNSYEDDRVIDKLRLVLAYGFKLHHVHYWVYNALQPHHVRHLDFDVISGYHLTPLYIPRILMFQSRYLVSLNID